MVWAKTGTGSTFSNCQEKSLTSSSEPTTTTPAGRQVLRSNMPDSHDDKPSKPPRTCLTAVCVCPSCVSTMTTVAHSCSRMQTAVCWYPMTGAMALARVSTASSCRTGTTLSKPASANASCSSAA